MAISRHLLTWLAACAGTLLPLAATLSGNESLRTTSDALCASANPQVAEYRYTVTGRARPLLVWTGRRGVGSARVNRATTGSRDERIALLGGTDPERAPMRVNRWGFTSELRCGDHTEVVGLMTQSDETTIDQATVSVGTGEATRAYRAIRSSVDGRTAATETLRVFAPSHHTFRDSDRLLDMLPPRGATRAVALPDRAAPGFLVAVADALLRSAANPDGPSSATLYVYGPHVYDLQATVTGKRATTTIAGRSYARTIDVDFTIRNHSTGEITRFQVTAGTSATGGDLAGVPLRVLYRPRWWLELELALDGLPS